MDDHGQRIHALEGDFRRVEARLSGVETTLTAMASEAARSGQAILSRVEIVAGEVTAIKTAQTEEVGRKRGNAEAERRLEAERARAQEAADKAATKLRWTITTAIVVVIAFIPAAFWIGEHWVDDVIDERPFGPAE